MRRSSTAGRARRCASRSRSIESVTKGRSASSTRAGARSRWPTEHTPCWAPCSGGSRPGRLGVEEVAPVSPCLVRLYRQSDAEAIHAAAIESVAEVYPWMAWCHARYTLDESRQWVRLQIEAARQKKAFEFVIVGDDGRLLGGCGINQINPVNRFANLGYWVRSSATGRGVAPAAVRQVAAYAFRETDLNRLEIVIAVGNRRSQRVAEKIGATREGVLKSRLLLPSGPS